ncbi:threonyl-tRNA synthetase [Marinitoga hydrogenitolerans DSM 16785]|uniref:Threonine--tRNA ligase n=2 Tax=Marinitoga TaxID=160798 RepID=A0A1M4VFP7_MARH1|nr:threonine--tRNA ligase [Marinitoga hydrogenitolerans]SHE67787.1 threonyl-tRNA synthetase [Marinitoga hydrogenitolerans DSM 16785]
MDMIKIILPDGSENEYEKGISAADIAKKISEGLYRKALGALVNGELYDLTRPIEKDSTVKIITDRDSEAPVIFRHTIAHIMAQAVLRLYGKDVKLAIGPVIENGFYYDFDLEEKISEDDLPKIEAEMKKIIKENLPIERFEISKEEAKKLFKDQPYKLELLEDIEDETVTYYKQGEFFDLCRGPHLPSTGKIKHIKLLSVSGAYWRGNEKNKMLQRIYGTAFAKKDQLDEYLKMLEEARKRDHRKIGPKLDLFMFENELAPAMPFFLPRGAKVINGLLEFSRELHKKYGYEEVITPLIMNIKLWHQSGHWDHYKENMYFTEKDESQYAVKPMNCPGHILIYKSKVYSYKDLPVRMSEFGKVHRYERSGVVHGLFRVRSFTQDDAHIYCTKDQIEDEIIQVMNFTNELYSAFGFEYEADLSTMPEDHMGDEKTWEIATTALKNALERSGIKYKINEGDGAFYGPKIDFHIKDSIGRKWQCATIQLDFQMPERFDIHYVDSNNELQRPVMIHRAIYGSIERFFGILIENFAGAFPTWLSPEQVAVIPVSDKYIDAAKELYEKLDSEGFRVTVDTSNATVGYKIRNAQMLKIPYMIVIGEKELETKKYNVRTREGNTVENLELDDFIKVIKKEIKNRSLKLSY